MTYQMKKLFLTGIAALFLATGAAMADPADHKPLDIEREAHQHCIETYGRYRQDGKTLYLPEQHADYDLCMQREKETQREKALQEQPMCPAPQDENGNPTEIPCAELGVAYDCGQGAPGAQTREPDEIWINHGHIYSDLNSSTITIYMPNMAARKSRRYPVIRYDLETDEITLDGKPCHPVGG